MRIPVIAGKIKRRLLVNFRADPEVIQRFLPTPFRPKLFHDYAVVGVCLIRLEQIRPAALPGFLGISSENAAHRISVEWTDAQGVSKEGVYIPRRDTGSSLNRLAGGRIFPGEHHPARFAVRDDGQTIDFRMESNDHTVQVHVAGRQVADLPNDSCFKSLAAASAFFEGGSVGYSVTRDVGRLDGLRLETTGWRVSPLAVGEVHSSFFSERKNFPQNSVIYDHTLIMRDVAHTWHLAPELPSMACTCA